MRWKDVKREIVAAIGSIDLLTGRSYHYSVRKITPPAFIVDLPEEIGFHGAYADGMSRWRVPFTVAVGAVDARSSEDELSEYLEESGPRSVTAAVENHLYTSCSDVTVMRAEIAVVTFAGIQYLGALFSSDVTGKGR